MPNTADIAAQAGVRVKQLEWIKADTWKIANSAVGTYVVRPCLATNHKGEWLLEYLTALVKLYPSEADAMAGGQSHFASRILAEIEPQAVAEPVAFQYRYRMLNPLGRWSNWYNGKPSAALLADVENGILGLDRRSLYTAPVPADEKAVAWAQMINGTVVQVTDDREKMQSWINAGYPDIRPLGFASSVTASDERAVEAEPALSIARAAANGMLAANTQWRLDPKYILTICDALEAALAAAPKAQPVQAWQTPEVQWKADWERIAFNLCAEFGSEFVADKQTFAKAVVREYLASLRATETTQPNDEAVAAISAAIWNMFLYEIDGLAYGQKFITPDLKTAEHIARIAIAAAPLPSGPSSKGGGADAV